MKAHEIGSPLYGYTRAGIVLWEMYPQSMSIDVYAPGQPMRTLRIGETLDSGDGLPGFTLPIGEIFAD